MFISRIYKDEGLKFQSLSLAKMKEVVLFKSQGYYSSFLCGLLISRAMPYMPNESS